MKLMVPQKRMLSPALALDAIQTDRFKTETLSVTVTVPVDKALTPLYVLVLSILKRGTVSILRKGRSTRGWMICTQPVFRFVLTVLEAIVCWASARICWGVNIQTEKPIFLREHWILSFKCCFIR